MMSDTTPGCPATQRVGCAWPAGHLGLHRSADGYWWEGDIPTPAPALTDEQIERYADNYRTAACEYVGYPEMNGEVVRKFDTWLAAVIDRAKREERERIARALRVRADACTDERDRVTTRICADYALNVRMREATDGETR